MKAVHILESFHISHCAWKWINSHLAISYRDWNWGVVQSYCETLNRHQLIATGGNVAAFLTFLAILVLGLRAYFYNDRNVCLYGLIGANMAGFEKKVVELFIGKAWTTGQCRNRSNMFLWSVTWTTRSFRNLEGNSNLTGGLVWGFLTRPVMSCTELSSESLFVVVTVSANTEQWCNTCLCRVSLP